MTQNQAIKKTQTFVQKARESGINIMQIFLFGSYAKRVANKRSDIDVGIVIPYVKDRLGREVKFVITE